MTKERFLQLITIALYNKREPDFGELDSDEIFDLASDIYYENILLFENSVKSAKMDIERVSPDKFNLRVKGPAKYYSINGMRVIFGPYDSPITIDHDN